MKYKYCSAYHIHCKRDWCVKNHNYCGTGGFETKWFDSKKEIQRYIDSIDKKKDRIRLARNILELRKLGYKVSIN